MRTAREALAEVDAMWRRSIEDHAAARRAFADAKSELSLADERSTPGAVLKVESAAVEVRIANARRAAFGQAREIVAELLPE